MGDSLVIIIDQWHWTSGDLNNREPIAPELALRIIDFINNNKIHTAVLASYDCERDLYNDTVWYRNRLPFDNLVEYWPHECNQTTIDVILNYVNNDIFQIAMRNEQELAEYLGLCPKIKNIYITGSAWEICVKDRPLGYENVYRKFCQGNDRRILVSADCVESIDCTNAPKFDNQWQLLGNNVYQYCPD